MDHQDLRTLRLLEEIEKDHAPSQRDLARKLNASLGLVNSLLIFAEKVVEYLSGAAEISK